MTQEQEGRVARRTRPREVTVASMNLHCGVDEAGRRFEVEAVIRGLDAQVIALQETWMADGPDPVQRAADAIGAEVLQIPLSPVTTVSGLGIAKGADPGQLGMAVLSVFPVTGYEVASLGRVPGDVVPRCAQIVTIKLADGTAVEVAATHLTHRLLSPAQLWRLIRRLGRAQLPTIIAGDLNMPRLLAQHAPGYRPAVGGATWPAEQPLMQLDHVLASRSIEPVEGMVLAPAGSDHRGVRARLRVRG